jgi:hypothetical protein
VEDFSEATNTEASAVAKKSLFVSKGIQEAILINYSKYEELANLLN